MSFGRAILGDNQFLGVNHADQSKAASLYRQFSQADAIIEVIGWAYEAGVRDFMFTTHERYRPVFEEVLRSRMFPEMGYVPCLPYAHKYANAMAEKGMIEVMLDNVWQTSPLSAVTAVGRAVSGDFGGLMRMLVQIELLMTRGLPVSGVFLQNIFFDLMMGLNAAATLESFYRHVSESLGTVPGFITMNHAMAAKFLCDEIGLHQPWLCANFNVAGFRTHPSNEAVVASFASGRTRNIAMSVFASGALEADRSLAYALDAKGVDAILFGSSRRENIEKNTRTILDTALRATSAST